MKMNKNIVWMCLLSAASVSLLIAKERQVAVAATRAEFQELVDQNRMVVTYFQGAERKPTPASKKTAQRRAGDAANNVYRALEKYARDPYYVGVEFSLVKLAPGEAAMMKNISSRQGKDVLVFYLDGKRKARVEIEGSRFSESKMEKFLEDAKVDDYVEQFHQKRARGATAKSKCCCQDCGSRTAVGWGWGWGPGYYGYNYPANWWYGAAGFPGWSREFNIGFGYY